MADGLITVLLEQLASVDFKHTTEVVTLVNNFSSSLKAIQAVLEDAEKRQLTEAGVRDWLQKIKDVSYEMDDVLGEWNYEILKQQVAEGHENDFVTKKKVCFPIPSSCFCFGQVSKATHHHNIAIRIKELNVKLAVIAGEKDKYGFHPSTIRGTDEQLIQHQNTSSLVDISRIFGREEEKKNLLSMLLRESNQDGGRFLVIPIVGMGGMGKTTLTQLVYNDEIVRTHYDKKVWVCVSDPFDEIKIAKAIIEGLSGNQNNSNELETLLSCIRSHVENRRLLLVLDDVWTEDQNKWKNLKLPVIMQSCAQGSTILVTTRKQGVAKMMRAANNMIHLDPLNDEDCLALFNSFAFLGREEDEADEFGAIGKEIVKMCNGLPLAAKTLGGLVCYKKTEKEWRDVMNERLVVIAGEKDNYGFHPSTIRGTDEQLILHQKTSSLVDLSMIFGREEEKKNLLLNMLFRESNQDEGRFLIIPIVGMGGIGKTTLTQLVYNDEIVRTHYDKKVWVCVSDPFDEIKIAKVIIEGLSGNQNNSNELEILLSCIRSHVENKRLLLVLDDVWTEDQNKWENLKLPVIMQSCAQGSAILVTTRKQGVAKMMRATHNMMHLDRLNDEDCLPLFNSFAFLGREEDEADEFGAIGKEIVKKCKGLPLAAKILGSLVRNKKTKEEWWDVVNSKISELEVVEEQVFRSLLLSYYDLAHAVKMCLLYCAVFPKDYNFKKDHLIELWMSQGYLSSREDKETRREGQHYFESLAMKSFFQDLDKDEMGNIIGCKMHDIVHDFLQFLTQKECIIIEKFEGANQRMEPVRHLTLTSVPEGPLSLHVSCKNMRTLIILDSRMTVISPSLILQMKCLRTLSFSDNSLQEVPKEIGELIHLRYLDLSRSEALKELPEAVCDLCNLQTLVLVGCNKLEKLPKAMGKLINLKHLYVWGCHRLRYLPKGIGSLKSLQVLDKFYVCEGDDEEALKLGDLGNMDQLQGRLQISILGNNLADWASEIEKAHLGNKEHLSHLEVCFHEGYGEQRKGDEEIVKALQPHQNLEYLSIWNCHATTKCLSGIGSLLNLREVNLEGWKFCEILPPLGKLPSLEILEIEWIDNVKKVGVEFLGREGDTETLPKIVFPKLKQLSFRFMPNWEDWRGLKDSSEITIMPCLSSLQIWYCPELKALPDFMHKITTLLTLRIGYCPILERDYQKGVGKKWHNISHIRNLTIGYGDN